MIIYTVTLYYIGIGEPFILGMLIICHAYNSKVYVATMWEMVEHIAAEHNFREVWEHAAPEKRLKFEVSGSYI